MLNDKNNEQPLPHQDDDEESAACEADAAEARRRGTELIEEHLSHHMEQNPDSSYVTWIACLHPENAEVTIDERFLIPGNPWWAVYEGAKADIPTATATPVVVPTTPTISTTAGGAHNGAGSQSALTVHQPNNSPKATTALDHRQDRPTPTSDDSSVASKKSSGLDLFIGCILSAIAILTVFGMEVGAFAVYIVSAGFYKMAQVLDPPSAFTGIFYSVFLLVYYILSLVDSCLLISSVLITEIVALTLFLLSFLFAGYDMAKRWHQYLRRTCHLLRWAFRSKSLSSHPPRHLCLVCLPNKHTAEGEEEDEDGQDNKDTEAIAAAAFIEQGDHEHSQWLGLVNEPPKATPFHDNTIKENWIDKVEAPPPRSLTPSAPPSEEHDVIVLDESNVFLDHNGNAEKAKKESHYPW